jgi:hypothetical protein
MLRMSTVARSTLRLLSGVLVLGGCQGDLLRLGNGHDAGTTMSDAADAQGPDSTGGAIDVDNCLRGQIKASEVTWIGDTWVTLPGTQHTRVRDLARAAGAIGATDDYTILAAPFASMAAVATQYANQQATQTKVKVLIMDGGTYDTIQSGGSNASAVDVAATFRQLLAQVAADGTVEHIVYYLCPEVPGIPGVAALRPLLSQACMESSVPCHFLDLQPLWAGHPAYTDSSGIQSSAAGAKVIADAIWAIMQQSCIAQ